MFDSRRFDFRPRHHLSLLDFYIFELSLFFDHSDVS